MNIDKTTRLIRTRSEENANLLLRVEWTILLIADSQEDAYLWLHYQFGWPREGELPELTVIGVEGGTDPF
jgi:hypothetical protein